jgi:hypothetical protein
MNQQDRDRKRALVVFQVAIYGYLALMIAIQLHLWAQRSW